MIITLTKVSQEFAKNGSEYRKVTGATGDGRETTKSIFNQLEDKWPLLVEGATLEFSMEKKGQYWNVTDIKPISEVLNKEPAKLETAELDDETKADVKQAYKDATDKMSKGDWDEKDKRTRKSIEKQTSLNCAIKMAELNQAKEVGATTSKVIATAKEFEKYLEGV